MSATKTWSNPSDNPRPEHDIDGETVDIEETFSNGEDAPGEDAPGCECFLTVDVSPSDSAAGPAGVTDLSDDDDLDVENADYANDSTYANAEDTIADNAEEPDATPAGLISNPTPADHPKPQAIKPKS